MYEGNKRMRYITPAERINMEKALQQGEVRFVAGQGIVARPKCFAPVNAAAWVEHRINVWGGVATPYAPT